MEKLTTYETLKAELQALENELRIHNTAIKSLEAYNQRTAPSGAIYNKNMDSLLALQRKTLKISFEIERIRRTLQTYRQNYQNFFFD